MASDIEFFNGIRRWTRWLVSPILAWERRELEFERDHLGKKLDIAQAEAEKNARLAHTDKLTGLLNRHGANEYMLAACRSLHGKIDIAKEDLENSGILVVILDLDMFNKVNKEFGHAGGDIVLKEFARRLKKCTRQELKESVYQIERSINHLDINEDVVLRTGGEEFTLFLPFKETPDFDILQNIAERITNGVSGEYKVNDKSWALTVSAGMDFVSWKDLEDTVFGLKNGYTQDELLEKVERLLFDRADDQAYIAKDTGRACVFFDESAIYSYKGKLSQPVIDARAKSTLKLVL